MSAAAQVQRSATAASQCEEYRSNLAQRRSVWQHVVPIYSGLFMGALLVAMSGGPLVLADENPTDDEKSALEEQFGQTLRGATLVGRFTDSAQPDDAPLPSERYTIRGVRKLEGNDWLFQARIQYGDYDVTVPLTLPVHWAGDTPIITVDNVVVPGIGKYVARVMIFEDHYAGFWKGHDHGGHLFGRVVRDSKPDAPAEE